MRHGDLTKQQLLDAFVGRLAALVRNGDGIDGELRAVEHAIAHLYQAIAREGEPVGVDAQ